MTQQNPQGPPPQWRPSQPPQGQYPRPPQPQPHRELQTALWLTLRIIGGAVGVLFLIMALSFLFAEPIWLPAALLFAISWTLLYFSAVVPLLKRRKRAPAPSQPGDRVGSAMAKIAIGIATPFAFVILVGALDVSVNYDELAAYGTDPSEQETPASSTPGSTSELATDTAAPLAFSEGMVRAHGVTKDDEGGQSNVRFVAGTDDPARIDDLQRQCVQHYLRDTKAAYCYGYANDADYALTTVEWTPEFDESPYGGGRPCWIIYGGQPVAGPPGTETAKSAIEYRTLGCPGGVGFPDDTPPALTPEGAPPPATVPTHDACALLAPAALVAGGFSDRTSQAPGAPGSTAHGDILATYACGNADSSVVLEIDMHNSPESAREAADDNTSADQTFLIDGGTRVPFDANRGGAKIINTEFGISRVSWSSGPYAVMLEVMSDPAVPGLTAVHPHERIDAMITTTVDHADARLAGGGW
ncbi:hypothetical protein [Rhodococcus sp. IEGM 1307]|uniref:hypothetical protein n=1 Tax=Rhodococcus sp. IEGM 1307 TaxID=3047091 RepID=UPI0024B7776C|nr:hypothetical protein [Rhodococcus sp. IEGM 1307]MDI9979815.1 hypothetical protein [Rhodococcus sp. IEGM 1307]